VPIGRLKGRYHAEALLCGLRVLSFPSLCCRPVIGCRGRAKGLGAVTSARRLGKITDAAQNKDLLSALRFGNTVPATGMFRGLAGRSAEEVSKRRGVRVGSGTDIWYGRELNSRFGFCFLSNETLGSFG